MTVEVTTTVSRVAANGVTRDFNFSFRIFNDTDLVVRDIVDATGVPTVRTLNVDYTVTKSNGEGGFITFDSIPAVNHTIDMRSLLPLQQPTSVKNQGPFHPELHEDVFDRLERQGQDSRRLLDGAIRLPDYEIARDMSLPKKADIAGKYLACDANGQPIGAFGTGNDSALRSDLAVSSAASAGTKLSGFGRNETGAVARTAYQILNFFRSIEDFGATTASSDNATQIQAAIDAASAAGGGVVIIPEGTYISTQLALKSNVRIMGFGYKSCLKSKNSANAYLLANTNGAQYVDDVTIRDIRIDGNKANNTSGGGIYAAGRRNFILNNYIHDTNDACILFGAAGAGVANVPDEGFSIIAGNICVNPGDANNWGAIGITHGKHILIENNVCDGLDGNMTYGIDVEPNNGNMCTDIVIRGNTIRAGRIFVDGAPMGGTNVVSRVLVQGNNIDARGSYSPADSSNMACVFLRQATDITVVANNCQGHDTRTFVLIHCEEGGTTTTWNIENLTVANNIFRSASAIARSGRFSVCRNVIINGNQWEVNTPSSALEFPATTRVRGTCNTIRNAGAGNAISLGSATAVDCQFDETNSLLGTVSVNATAFANGCEVRRFLKGSATYDPPNLADGAGATTTVTVTGAALGDYVDDVSFSLDLQGITVTAYVSVANTVAVRFQNESGGALDLASGTLSVRVLKVA